MVDCFCAQMSAQFVFHLVGLKLVKARAEAMQMASEIAPGGMLSVQIDHESSLSKAMEVARRWCAERKNIRDPYCQIASYLFPEGRVIAGNMEVTYSFCLRGYESYD